MPTRPRRRRRTRSVDSYAERTGLPDILFSIIKKILDGDDALSIFKDVINIGSITSNGSFVTESKLIFSQDEEVSVAGHDYGRTAGSTIKIAEFSPRQISNYTLYGTARNSRRESTADFYSNIYSKYWANGAVTSKRIGINVCKKAKVKGYILNFNDVRKLLEESGSRGRRYSGLLDYINEFYYAGPKNCLLGIATTNGNLIIRKQALIRLIENNTEEVFTKCLHNLFTCFHKTHSSFIELNIRTFKEEMAELVEQSALNSVVNKELYSQRYYRRSDSESDSDQFMDEVKSFITDQLQTATSGTVFGATDSYSYTNLINQVMNNRHDHEKALYKEGFDKGMQIGLKFEMMGWEPSRHKFTSDHTSIWWEKVVDIHPDTLVKNSQRYLIPEDQRHHYHITKLYINQSGNMQCDGTHPNVSGGRVCMGDLRDIDFSGDVSDIQDILTRVEDLLDIINYDSAYNYDRQEHLLEVSEKVEMLHDMHHSDTDKDLKKKSGIRELGEDFDDDEEEEDIAEEEGEEPQIEATTQIIDGDEIIAHSINYDTSEEVQRDEDNYDDYNNQHTHSEEGVSQSEDIENMDVSDVSYVNEDGTRRSAVYVTTPPRSNNAPSQFILGDGNLIRSEELVGDEILVESEGDTPDA